MQKFLRLTSNNLRNLSLFQFTKIFQSSKSKLENMSKPESTDSTVQNANGMVKFLELVGNLKVCPPHIKLLIYFIQG